MSNDRDNRDRFRGSGALSVHAREEPWAGHRGFRDGLLDRGFSPPPRDPRARRDGAYVRQLAASSA